MRRWLAFVLLVGVGSAQPRAGVAGWGQDGTPPVKESPPPDPGPSPKPEPSPQPEPPPDPARSDPGGPGNPADTAPTGEAMPECVLVLRDGRRLTGLLVERGPLRVTLRMGGIDVTYPAEQVERVEVLPPVIERYREMRQAIHDRDSERLLLLAEWLRARGQLDVALLEIEHVLGYDPGNAEARRLHLLVTEQRRLRQTDGSGAAGGPGATARPPREPFPLLTPEQINLIKVFEVDLRDPPRMVIPRDTITRLLEMHAGDPLLPTTQEGRDLLYRQRPEKILGLMFRLRARPLYGEVRVLDHPESMARFRDDVHRGWLLNSCATTRCHGGTQAGRLRLNNTRPNSDATVYTNFLILERFVLSGEGAGTRLINHDEPARSPLLHMGLRRDESLWPHPPALTSGRSDAWHAVFRSADDQRFRQAVEWINSLYRPRPEYPIEYVPPGAGAPGIEAPGPADEPTGR